MKSKLLLIFCMLLPFKSFADIIIKADDILLNVAFKSISKDLQLQLVNEVSPSLNRQIISQDLSGNSFDILNKLSQVYDFSWYVYGGLLVVKSESDFVNYIYKPNNIKSNRLMQEINAVIKTSTDIKMAISKKNDYLFFSGPSRFIRDIMSYSQMIDNNYFLEEKNNLEVSTIKFDYISVQDRTISSYDNDTIFLGAGRVIEQALSNIGQFQNASSEEILNATHKIKLENANKPILEDDEKTSKVMVLNGINAILVRGTPSEVALAKRIAKIIDIKAKQIMFSLKVYDIAVEKLDTIGIDNSFLGGNLTLYDFLSLPFLNTDSFLKLYQAMSNNGIARAIYQTNIISLENQRSHFGKKDTASIKIVSKDEIDIKQIEADNSLYVTGRLLPSGDVLAKVEYIEEKLDDASSNTGNLPRVTSQSVLSEVYINPKSTAVLGGFEITLSESTETGIPLLSQIPLLGLLFKSTTETKRKYKRYVSISFEVI